MDETVPENELGQPPTRTPEETEARLRDKERAQRGRANRERTEAQIDAVKAGRREPSAR